MRKELLWLLVTMPLILGVLTVCTMVKVTAQEMHNITVISVTPSSTSADWGESVNITVVVENQGNAIETFNVTVYYDTATIETQDVASLAAGANTSLTFTWDTEDVWIDTLVGAVPYKIKAVASTVDGETDTADNTLVSQSRVRVVTSPHIAVFPHSTVNPNLTKGTTYTVSIKTDYNGSDITSWQFTLKYNPNILHGVEVTDGDLITTAKDPSARFMKGTFDNTDGKLGLTSALFAVATEPFPITSGPGTLANITFEVVGVGESSITIGVGEDETKLKGYSGGGYGDPFNIVEGFVDADHIGQGYFRNAAAEVIHDVAVVSVKPNTTDVERGELVEITVKVKNNGTATEDVTVTLNRCPEAGVSTWIIGTKTAHNLAADANTSLTFIWDTSGVRSGNHIITATAEPVSGETNTDNNTRESEEMITVRAKPEKPIPLELIVGAVVGVVVTITLTHKSIRRNVESET